MFSVNATISAVLLRLLVWLHTENRFQQVCVQPKIAPLNGTLLVSLVFCLNPLYTISTLPIQMSCVIVNIVYVGGLIECDLCCLQ